MNSLGLEFHHFGLAVPQPEAAFKLLTRMGYDIGPVVFDPLQLVRLAMCWHPQMPDVEVVSPSDAVSPIDRLLRRNGPLFYHVCYVTPRIDAALTAIEREGFNIIVVSEPKPAILFGGREVAFCSVDGFGLIELLQDHNLPSTGR
jgi:methylmalonyl-CoA/ethylmalonyl-CoA epimerase